MQRCAARRGATRKIGVLLKRLPRVGLRRGPGPSSAWIQGRPVVLGDNISGVHATGAPARTSKPPSPVSCATDDHVEVEATWGIYQRLVAAYRDPNRRNGKTMLTAVIGALTDGVPAALVELRRLGRTLTKRAADVLAYFDRPGTSNGPTEAINGRLEHLRGSALGFRNLTHYIDIARSLLESGGFRPRLHRGL